MGTSFFGISRYIANYFAWFTSSFCHLHQAQFRVSSPVPQWLSNYLNKDQQFRATVHSWNMVHFTPQMQEVSRCHLQNRFKYLGVTFTSEQLESQMSGWFGGAVKMQALSENWDRRPSSLLLFISVTLPFWNCHRMIDIPTPAWAKQSQKPDVGR